VSDAIKAGTILIEEGASMPESLLLEGGPFSSGWRSVSNLDRKQLDREINQAGWTFFFMAGETKICNALERKRRMKLAARLRGADASKSYDHKFAASVSGRKQADGGREHEG
jgi:hypothetical protein